VQEALLAPAETGDAKSSRIRILMVMPAAEASKLQPLLEECGAEVLVTSSCVEAREVINSGAPIRAMLTARSLPDSRIRDLLDVARRCPRNTPLILCLPEIDGGWIDLMEEGAFALLVEPYRREEVQRIIDAVAFDAQTHLTAAR
jgi:DNA-binding NtrC family response regulator